MSTSAHNLQVSSDEYLKGEEASSIRHEFVGGRVFAMVGASEAHNSLVSNLHLLIGSAIKGTGCRAFVSDMKVRVDATDSFYYPDLMVTCEEYLAQSLFKTAPRLIVEVLSPSTTDIDRREKLAAYRSIPSLIEYVIVYQDERRVEVSRRTGSTGWEVGLYKGRDVLTLHPVNLEQGVQLSLDDVYEGVLASIER